MNAPTGSLHQSTAGERFTAAISTVVAIAILSAAVTAQPDAAPQGDRLAGLESDLRFQLDLAFRQDRGAYKARIGDLDAALNAWHKSPHSVHDRRLFEDWLHKSLAETIPGRTGQLPPTPKFGSLAPATAGEIHAASIGKIGGVVDLDRPTSPTPITGSGAAAGTRPTLEAVEVSADGAPIGVPRRLEFEPVVPIVVRPAQTILISGDHERSTGENDPQPELASDDAAPLPAAPAALSEGVEHSVSRNVPPLPSVAATPPSEVPDAIDPESLFDDPGAADAQAIASPAVSLNLAELNARISGYHQDLAEVEAAIISGSLSRAELESLVGRLESLAGRRQFVELYYDALTVHERRRVVAPRPMDDVIALVSSQVTRAMENADILDDFDASTDETATLAERLKAVADAVGVGNDR